MSAAKFLDNVPALAQTSPESKALRWCGCMVSVEAGDTIDNVKAKIQARDTMET